MKKRGASIIISILIISVFAMQSVSAGFFDDFFNQITGSSVEEGATETAAPPPEPAPVATPEPTPAPVVAETTPVETPVIAAPVEAPVATTPETPPTEIITTPAEPPAVTQETPQQPIPQKQERQCDTFVDGAGCTVTNCNDGFHEQICPERKEPQGVCYAGSERAPCPGQSVGEYQKNQVMGGNAPTDGKCYSGEKEVPCPEGKQPGPAGGWVEKPQGPVTSADGCPVFNMMPGPEREQCEAKGGFVNQRKEGNGCMSPPICIFSQESFGQGETKEQCRRFVDQMGIMRVECQGGKWQAGEKQCPPDSEEKKQRIKKECSEKGGNIVERTDNLGCSFFECSFPGEKQMFLEKQTCPTREETDSIAEKCKSMNMDVIIVKEMECLIAKCSESKERTDELKVRCAEDDPQFRQKIKDDCIRMNGVPYQSFDKNGCAVTYCGPQEQEKEFEEKYCTEKPPIEAYKRCEQDGGELVVKTNDKGCVDYTKCVMRGDERKINYDDLEIAEMPSTARLLSVAMKLEELKINLDRLARRTDSIADYYESVNDYGSSGRFRKASGMFDSAKSKVDEIKTKLRSRAKDIKEEDIMEIKHDVKYIDEVILQDILYVMLSTEGEAEVPISRPAEKEKIAEKEKGRNCYGDGRCFDNHLRVCDEGTTFMPEQGTTVAIKGIDNKNCVIKVEADTPAGAMEMTCKYPDYAFGLKGPEELLPYCEGSMTAMVAKGTKAEKAERVERVEKAPKEEIVYPINKIENAGNELQYRQDTEVLKTYPQEEKFGIEYGRLGCNEPGSLENLKKECKSKKQFACEIDVPGCGPWVVCEKSPSSCPPRNYCELNPGACPTQAAAVSEEKRGDAQ